MIVYLDNNATTALAPEVLEVMVQELNRPPSNPSSNHQLGKKAKSRLEAARVQIASCLKVAPDELIFTSSGTEAVNLAIRGFCKNLPLNILSSNIEHSCIDSTLKCLETIGCKVYFLEAGIKGFIAKEEVEAFLKAQPVDLLILSYVNSETGTKNDIEAIAEIARIYKVPFIVDAVAILGKEEFAIPEGVSAMAFSAHKLHGPKGVGLLYKKKSFKIDPLISGGGQEKAFRSGTENLAGIVGFSKAIELFYQDAKAISDHLRNLKEHLVEKLQKSCPPFLIHGEGPKINNTVNISFEGVDGETLLIMLDMNGVLVSHGSACSSYAIEPSRILIRMGVAKEIAKGAIRFSLSRMNTKEEIDKAVDYIGRIVQHLRSV